VFPVIENYEPDLILISAGFNGLETDPQKLMNLTTDCYAEMLRYIVLLNIPTCLVLEDSDNYKNISECYSLCIKQLL